MVYDTLTDTSVREASAGVAAQSMQPIVDEAFLVAARRAYRGSASAADTALLHAAGWRRLTGGRNNTVYACQQDGQTYCLKCYKTDGRDRVGHEWRALTLLSARGHHFAPRPYQLDTSTTPPIVVMEHIAGEGIGDQPLSQAQLLALVETFAAFFAITPATTSTRLSPVYGTAARIVQDLHAGMAVCGAHRHSAEQAEAWALWQAWQRGNDPALLLQEAPLVFAHGDGSLENCLWDGQRLGLIDFEYSGWSDRAFELAVWIEHVRSRGTPDDAWEAFVAGFALSPAEACRFAAARRLFALFWLMKWWPSAAPDLPDAHERFGAQLQRARRLLRQRALAY